MNTKFIIGAITVATDLERAIEVLNDLYNELNYANEKQAQIKVALSHIQIAKVDFFNCISALDDKVVNNIKESVGDNNE